MSDSHWFQYSLFINCILQIEAVVTKDELQHLTFLCKSEVDSFGRVAAGVLRLLKLEGSIGQGAINQLSNLGKFLISVRQLNFISQNDAT